MTPEFWEVIEDTRPVHHSPSAHAEAITSRLVDSGMEAVREFAAEFDEAMDGLYTWDLWGTAYLSLGGCSDDAFDYLRAWLIGSGEAFTRRAITDPEGLIIDLLNQSESPDSRWGELGLGEGEALLYAAGRAHEHLTGEWLPGRSRPLPDQPDGDPWVEEELADRFPALHKALPDDWWDLSTDDDGAAGSDQLRVMIEVDRGLDAFLAGNHVEASRHLSPVVDDLNEWGLVPPENRTDVAYVVGIGRLAAGDVEGASFALRLVESELGDADHVRRALVQVELARGDLDSAASWSDTSDDAARLDRALAAKLAWRRGDHEEALRRAAAEMTTPVGPDEHPWDVAGTAFQLGQIFADAGELNDAVLAVGVMTRLLEGAPRDLPLLTHLNILVAAVTRLQGGPEEALTSLRQLRSAISGTDLAECLREEARCEKALRRPTQAAALYQASVETFEAAGELWEARATRDEASRLNG